MPTQLKPTYNLIAGNSVERIAALSDGVFAVAMTLVLLDLKVPALQTIHSEADLWKALQALGPRLLVYVLSFMTLGIFWIGQQTQLNHLHRANRSLSWIHLAFLFGVTLMPFSTSLLAEFTGYRTPVVVYWLNILLLGVLLFFTWQCAVADRLVKADITDDIARAIRRRIFIAQITYALGASLCVFNPHWSTAVIILAQLNYVFAPFERRKKHQDSPQPRA